MIYQVRSRVDEGLHPSQQEFFGKKGFVFPEAWFRSGIIVVVSYKWISIKQMCFFCSEEKQRVLMCIIFHLENVYI